MKLKFNPETGTGKPVKVKAPRVAAPPVPDDPLWASQSLTDLIDALQRAAVEAVHVGVDVGIGGALAVTGRRGGIVVGAGVFDLPTTTDANKSNKATRQMLHLEVLAEMVFTLPQDSVVVLERYMPIPTARAQEMHLSDATAVTQDRKVGGLGPGEYHNLRLCAAAAETRGVVAGLARVRRIRRLDEPTPQQWRTVLGLKGADKESLRAAALRRFPGLSHMLWAQTHHDRAEALLLCDFAAKS